MALVFDAKRKDDGVWCEYMGGVKVKVRPMSRSTFRRLRKEATTKEARMDERGRRVEEERVDEERLDRELYRYMIEDWSGIVDGDGEPVPCTPEMVDAVCDRLPNFAAWVAEEANGMELKAMEKKDTALKNLQGSHGGSRGNESWTVKGAGC